jgi:hypothetical protein
VAWERLQEVFRVLDVQLHGHAQRNACLRAHAAD